MGVKNLLKTEAVLKGGDVLANYNEQIKDANEYAKKCADKKMPIKSVNTNGK